MSDDFDATEAYRQIAPEGGTAPEYDIVRFLECEGGQMDGQAKWIGDDWPPPQELWVGHGAVSGESVIFDLSELDDETVAELGKCTSVTVIKYRLHMASQITERLPGVLRGAEYHREEGA